MVFTNSADPDQTAHKEQSDQGLTCLHGQTVQILSVTQYSMIGF